MHIKKGRGKFETGTVTDKMVHLQIDTYITDMYNYRQTCLIQTVTEQTGILQTSIFNRIFHIATFELRPLQTRTDKDRQTGTLQQKCCWSAGTSPTRMLLVPADQSY